MHQEISDAISLKLNQEFGDSYKIYSEEVEQGFIRPCFFIGLLKSVCEKKLGSRYFFKTDFDVMFYPDDINKNKKILDMALGLYGCMDSLRDSDGNVYRGTRISHEAKDGVLHFYIGFDFCAFKLEDSADAMGVLNLNSDLKE